MNSDLRQTVHIATGKQLSRQTGLFELNSVIMRTLTLYSTSLRQHSPMFLGRSPIGLLVVRLINNFCF